MIFVNKTFVVGNKYVCLRNFYQFKKGETYLVEEIDEHSSNIRFLDKNNQWLIGSRFDFGYFMTPNQLRKAKINRINSI